MHRREHERAGQEERRLGLTDLAAYLWARSRLVGEAWRAGKSVHRVGFAQLHVNRPCVATARRAARSCDVGLGSAHLLGSVIRRQAMGRRSADLLRSPVTGSSYDAEFPAARNA
jgi:hypothetical protein